MCEVNTSVEQIKASIEALRNATGSKALIDAQAQSIAFINASYEAEEISQKEKLNFERLVRKVYRSQLIEESA